MRYTHCTPQNGFEQQEQPLLLWCTVKASPCRGRKCMKNTQCCSIRTSCSLQILPPAGRIPPAGSPPAAPQSACSKPCGNPNLPPNPGLGSGRMMPEEVAAGVAAGGRGLESPPAPAVPGSDAGPKPGLGTGRLKATLPGSEAGPAPPLCIPKNLQAPDKPPHMRYPQLTVCCNTAIHTCMQRLVAFDAI